VTIEGCRETRELAAEIALGVASGDERARALEHFAGCEDCQVHLSAQSETADGLLELAPRSEPTVGFEDRVFAALRSEQQGAARAGKRPSVARRLRPALALAAAAVAGAAAAWLAGSGDRDLASEYQDVLAVANGSYFEANHLEAPGGERVGYAYGYEGRTSWVLVVLYDLSDGRYRLVGASPGGRHAEIATVDVVGGNGTAGGALEGAYDDVTEVRLFDDSGREVADAELGGG
jgi:hypothetical protein